MIALIRMVSLSWFASEAKVLSLYGRRVAAYVGRLAIFCLIVLGLTGCAESDAPSSDSITDAAPLSQLPPAAAPDTATAEVRVNVSRGQTLYVPVYSHIHLKTQERTFNLATTVSIRNTDQERAIVLSTIDYIDNSGELVRRYLKSRADLTLSPLHRW